MHPELVRLLELQEKDLALLELDVALEELAAQEAVLDAAVEEARQAIGLAQRAEDDADRRHHETAGKLEGFRSLQERRRQQLDQVTRPRDAAAVMAEIDLAKSVIVQEEQQLLRLAEERNRLAAAVKAAESRVDQLQEEQAEAREALAQERDAIEAKRGAARADREATAQQVDKAARHRYDRLRKSRSSARVVVPLASGACGACFTTVPLSRRTQIQQGLVLEGCEMCGVILYAPDAEDDG
jgi:predicted  nucleic acid-binding Zn-ribbon protein